MKFSNDEVVVCKEQITNGDDPHFKALYFIYTWDTLSIKRQLNSLQAKKPWATVEDTVPFIKELFRSLMQFYFLGESQMMVIIKNLYEKMAAETSAAKKQNFVYAKQAAGEWMYIFDNLIKGLYPLLMRMTLSECVLYPDFYTQHITKVLEFLGITKYDLVLPKKQKKGDADERNSYSKQKEEDKSDAEKQSQPKNKESVLPKETILQSLQILERLFPQSGWINLVQKPDMYSYFHPLYQFDDGFNLISPANPLQVTIVLLQIIEDFFQGCRNITFNIDKDEDSFLEQDSLQKIIADWSQYSEVIFNKIMNPDFRDYVNHIYTQKDFKTSKYGKKQLSNWLWQIKYYFHPHLAFEITFVERPKHDDTYKSLPQRIQQLVQLFSFLISNSNTEEGAKKANFGETYKFHIENNVSYRLKVLLGGEKSKVCTNLNLMRYTLCALRMLDWWINDPESIAYQEEIKMPYRTKTDEGEPVFSVVLRSDQKKVFLQHTKKLVTEKAQSLEEDEVTQTQPTALRGNTDSNIASASENSKSNPPTTNK